MNGLFTKAERKKIRQICGSLCEKELSQATSKLAEEFKNWKGGKICTFTLNEKIHKFNQETSKKIFNRYERINTTGHLIIACAIANKQISKSEVPKEIFEKIEPVISVFD